MPTTLQRASISPCTSLRVPGNASEPTVPTCAAAAGLASAASCRELIPVSEQSIAYTSDRRSAALQHGQRAGVWGDIRDLQPRWDRETDGSPALLSSSEVDLDGHRNVVTPGSARCDPSFEGSDVDRTNRGKVGRPAAWLLARRSVRALARVDERSSLSSSADRKSDSVKVRRAGIHSMSFVRTDPKRSSKRTDIGDLVLTSTRLKLSRLRSPDRGARSAVSELMMASTSKRTVCPAPLCRALMTG